MANNEDIKKDDVTPSPSGEKTEIKDQETETKSQDIDFKKEAEELEKKTPPKTKRTPQEEIKYNLSKMVERAKEAGIDPAEILGAKKEEEKLEAETSEFATKRDLAEIEVNKLASSQDEKRVIMWWIDNKGLSVEDAHYMANKGRVKTAMDEIIRSKNKPPMGAGESSGQKDKTIVAPELPREQHNVMVRRGFKLVKPGLYQAKYTQSRFDAESKTWVSEKISQK
jgi:hypothetical protein